MRASFIIGIKVCVINIKSVTLAIFKNYIKNDYGKICYLFVIIVNHINEVQKKIKAQKRVHVPTVEIPPEIEDISNKANQNKSLPLSGRLFVLINSFDLHLTENFSDFAVNNVAECALNGGNVEYEMKK